MRTIKLGNVAVTYWEKRGTLMFQGPGEPAAELNKNFLDYKRGAESEEAHHIVKTSTNRDHEGNSTMIPSPEPWREAQII